MRLFVRVPALIVAPCITVYKQTLLKMLELLCSTKFYEMSARKYCKLGLASLTFFKVKFEIHMLTSRLKSSRGLGVFAEGRNGRASAAKNKDAVEYIFNI